MRRAEISEQPGSASANVTEKPPYKCHLCCKTYVYKKHFKKHVAQHAENDQVMYSRSPKQNGSDCDVRDHNDMVVQTDMKLRQGLHCWKVRLERISI